MLTRSGSIEKASVGAALRPGPVLVLAILSLPLAFVYLIESFLVIRGVQDARVAVCLMELFFVGALHVDGRYARTPSPSMSRMAGWLFLAWLASASISVMLSDHLMHAAIRQAEWICHSLFAYSLWTFLRREAAQAQWILLMIPFGFFLTGLILLMAWFSHPTPAEYNWFTATPIFGHIRYVGYYALAGLVFSMSPLLGFGRKTSRGERLLAGAAMTFCWAFLFWTGGRAALGAAAVGAVLFFWFARRKQRGWVAGISLFAAAAGAWLSTLFRVNDARMGFFQSIERTASAGSANALSTGRLDIWTATVEALQDNLWFGLGPEGYLFLETKTFGVHPHNLLLQFLTEWGLVGTIFFVALLALVFRAALVNLRRETRPLHRTARITAIALLAAFTIHSLVDGLYYHVVPLMVLFTSIAIALLPISSAESPASPSLLARLTTPLSLRLATAVLLLLFTSYYVVFFVL